MKAKAERGLMAGLVGLYHGRINGRLVRIVFQAVSFFLCLSITFMKSPLIVERGEAFQ